MAKKNSLAEMMGSNGAQQSANGLQLSRLHEILGDATPELPRNAVGRHRLIRALNQRFGKNFRSLPGISNLIKQFDSDLEVENKIAHISSIKASR